MKKKQIDVMNLDSLTVTELKATARQLKLKKVGDKSGKQISDEIANLVEGYVAGQGACHTYIHKRGQTGTDNVVCGGGEDKKKPPNP